MVGYIIIEKRTADGFEIFLLCLRFLISINRNRLLRGICQENAQIYAKTSWEISLRALGDHLSRTYRVLATLWEVPEED
jgi:hypothetical protein